MDVFFWTQCMNNDDSLQQSRVYIDADDDDDDDDDDDASGTYYNKW